MRCATTVLVTAIFAWTVAAARAQTAQPAAGTRKINPKDGLTYVWIPPATFRMGCLGSVIERPGKVGIEACLGNELPRHSVTLTRGFWIGQTLVMQVAYKRVTGSDRSDFRGDQLPVDTVSWDDTKTFCERWGCGCRRKRNGNGLRGEASSLNDTRCWTRSPGIGEIAAAGRMKSAGSSQTLTGCMTCWETCGSGYPTGTLRIDRLHHVATILPRL